MILIYTVIHILCQQTQCFQLSDYGFKIVFGLQKIKDRRLQSKLKKSEDNFSKAVKQAARAELLLAEEAGYD